MSFILLPDHAFWVARYHVLSSLNVSSLLIANSLGQAHYGNLVMWPNGYITNKLARLPIEQSGFKL